MTATIPIPDVCLLGDVCRHLRISRSTLKRLRRAHAFPIRELPSLDKHPRWSGADVRRFIEGEQQLERGRRDHTRHGKAGPRRTQRTTQSEGARERSAR